MLQIVVSEQPYRTARSRCLTCWAIAIRTSRTWSSVSACLKTGACRKLALTSSEHTSHTGAADGFHRPHAQCQGDGSSASRHVHHLGTARCFMARPQPHRTRAGAWGQGSGRYVSFRLFPAPDKSAV